MNIQGLIEQYEKFKANKKKLTSVDLVLKDLRSLDDPEPLPFKLKDVVGRIRGFDPTTQAIWLNTILKELGNDYGLMKYRSGYDQGLLDGAQVGNQLKDADKIRKELNKPVIPQFVAVWIEECKAKGKNLLRALLYTPEKVNSWVDDPDNQEIFALAWMFGYTVENEKRYTVVIKETKQPLYYNAVDNKLFFSMGGLATNFTQQQLEKLNFGWIFFCPGIEIEEVKG